MSTVEQVIMIILAGTLFVFLLLAIVLTVKFIKLANKLKEVADKAQEVAENVEDAAEMLRKTAGPIAIGRFLMNVADVVIKRGRKK